MISVHYDGDITSIKVNLKNAEGPATVQEPPFRSCYMLMLLLLIV